MSRARSPDRREVIPLDIRVVFQNPVGRIDHQRQSFVGLVRLRLGHRGVVDRIDVHRHRRRRGRVRTPVVHLELERVIRRAVPIVGRTVHQLPRTDQHGTDLLPHLMG